MKKVITIIVLFISIPAYGANVQAPLVSGVNIKTVNGATILGPGDLNTSSIASIDGGSSVSTYLTPQVFDCGNSTQPINLIIDGGNARSLYAAPKAIDGGSAVTIYSWY